MREVKRQAAERDDDSEFAISHDEEENEEEENGEEEDAEAEEPQTKKARAESADAVRELTREQKREIELSIVELQDELEEEGVDADVIEARCDALRKALTEKMAAKL